VARAGPLAAVVAALPGALATLDVPFSFPDDFRIVAALDGHQVGTESMWNLWNFSSGRPADTLRLIHEGNLGWDTPLEFKATFFRILASPTIALDHLLWGSSPIGYHLQSAAWYLVLVALVVVLLRRVLGRTTAVLAGVAFAIMPHHGEALYWLAARHYLVAFVLGAVALDRHLAWRTSRRPAQLALAVAGYLLAFLTSETALQLVCFSIAFELFGREASFRRRLASLATIAAPIVAYAAVHARYFGVTFGYHDLRSMIAAPAEALTFGSLQLARLIVELVLGVPLFDNFELFAHTYGGRWLEENARTVDVPMTLGLVFAAVVVLSIGVAGAWRSSSPRARAALRWLGPGTIASLVPTFAADGGPRLLFIPSLGAAAIFAVVFREVGRTSTRRTNVWWACAGLLLAVHYVAALPLQLHHVRTLGAKNCREETQAFVSQLRPIADVVPVGSREVVLLDVPLDAPYVRVMRWFSDVDTSSWWLAGSPPSRGGSTLKRTSDRALSVVVEGPIAYPHARGYESGDVVKVSPFAVNIVEVIDRRPHRYELVFPTSLDSPDRIFVSCPGGTCRVVSMPAVGEALELAP
jgi:hypothetical protein